MDLHHIINKLTTLCDNINDWILAIIVGGIVVAYFLAASISKGLGLDIFPKYKED